MARTWTVEINITEHEDGRRTLADAILRDVRPLPPGQEAPETGDEPATARALADLAYKALDVAAGDLGQFGHRRMRLLS